MRLKESWMFIGADVRALGYRATITDMKENTINGREYVYYITCKIQGENYNRIYHPLDVVEPR